MTDHYPGGEMIDLALSTSPQVLLPVRDYALFTVTGSIGFVLRPNANASRFASGLRVANRSRIVSFQIASSIRM
jgi:hypothetical protein